MTSKEKKLKNLEKGNRFSSTNQPKNVGRKPSMYRQILDALPEDKETLSMEDYVKIGKTLLSYNVAELKKVASNKDAPVVLVMIASAIAGDIENKQITNLEKLLDRFFGRSNNFSKLDITTNGKDVGTQLIFAETPLSEKDLAELIKIQNGNSSEDGSNDTGIQET